MLKLTHLTKRYGDQLALDAVDLTLEAGERVALLGHNGAGKSTLMKLILGLITPSHGEISVSGHAPGSPTARALTAYLPENVAFHPLLTGHEQVRHFLQLRGRSVKEADELLDKVGLSDAAGRRIGTYSKGMRQRVGLAQALIGDPRLMVLDEPTSGLDPVSRGDFYALLDGLAAHGTAILMSSHALSEVEARTDRITILSSGKKVAEGALSELRAKAALPLTVQLRPRSGCTPQLINSFPEATQQGNVLALNCSQSQKLHVLSRINDVQEAIEDFEFLPPSLDDIYAQISRGAQ